MSRPGSKRPRRKFLSKSTLFLIFSCFVVFVAVSHAELYVIPYLPYGGGWSSRIVVTNAGAEAAQVELKFFSKDGRRASVPVGAGEATESHRFTVDPSALRSLDVDTGSRDGEPGVAWATVESSGPVQIFSSFDSYASTAAGGGPPDQPPGRPPCIPPTAPGKPSCIPPSVPGTTPKVSAHITTVAGSVALPKAPSFQVLFSVYSSKSLNSRLALANPNETTATVEVTLIGSEGHGSVTRVLQIAPNGSISGLVTDPELFGREIDPSARFDGSVAICSDVPIGMLALGQEENLAFTLPVTTGGRCPGGLPRPARK